MISVNGQDSYLFFFSTILSQISNKSKIRILIILSTIFLNAFLDLLVLSSSLIFISILSGNSQILETNYLYQFISSDEVSTTYFNSCILFLSVIFSSSAIKILFLRLNYYCSALIGNEIGSLCFVKAISKDFESQKLVNTSEILNLLIGNIDATTAAINNLLLLSTSILSASFIVIGLTLINFRLAITLIFTILFVYLLITIFSRSRLRRVGDVILNSSIKRNSIIQESRGGIRDIILSNAISHVSLNYSHNDLLSKLAGAQGLFLSSYPRQVLEFCGYLLVGLIALFSFDQKNLIVNLGTFVLGIQRLLPNVQSIYMTWAGLRARYPAIKQVVAFLESPVKTEILPSGSLIFESLEFRNVSYRYPGPNGRYVLKNVNLKICKGDRVGIVGPSGSGKSTLLDLIMLLLVPTSGDVIINGSKVSYDKPNAVRAKWMNSIGHVPQDLFLIDDSIRKNITMDFGSLSEYSLKVESQVKDAAKMSCLHELITSLPNAYETIVGERGAFLSGGQKQRLGIARALFKSKGLLIFDEASSALDPQTESLLMQNIYDFADQFTLVMVAHRKQTLTSCSKFFSVENGKIQELSSLDLD